MDCHAADGFGGNVPLGNQPHRLRHHGSSDSGLFETKSKVKMFKKLNLKSSIVQ